MTFYQAPLDDDRDRHVERSGRIFRNFDADKTVLLEMLRHCVVVVFVAGFAMALVNAFDSWLPWPAVGIPLLALGIIGIAMMAKVAGNERGDTLREMLRHCVVVVFVAGFAMALVNAFDSWLPWPAVGILLALGIVGIAAVARVPGEKSRGMAKIEVGEAMSSGQSPRQSDAGMKGYHLQSSGDENEKKKITNVEIATYLVGLAGLICILAFWRFNTGLSVAGFVMFGFAVVLRSVMLRLGRWKQ